MASNDEKERAGDLLIQEVDEELRAEHYAKLWKRYSPAIIAAALIVIVGVAGWQGWRSWRDRIRNAEAERFAAASTLAADGKTVAAAAAMGRLAADSRTGFAAVAAMDEANLQIRAGDIKGALATLDRLASSDAPQSLRDLASLKGALLALKSDPAGAERRVGPLAASGNPWYYQAAEVMALAARAKGDVAQASKMLKRLADDPEAPQGVRARAAELLAAPSPVAAKG